MKKTRMSVLVAGKRNNREHRPVLMDDEADEGLELRRTRRLNHVPARLPSACYAREEIPLASEKGEASVDRE